MKSSEYVFKVDRKEINYIKTIVESYDGMAVVRTIDPHAALISIMIAPECEGLVFDLLADLQVTEGLRLDRTPHNDFSSLDW